MNEKCITYLRGINFCALAFDVQRALFPNVNEDLMMYLTLDFYYLMMLAGRGRWNKESEIRTKSCDRAKGSDFRGF